MKTMEEENIETNEESPEEDEEESMSLKDVIMTLNEFYSTKLESILKYVVEKPEGEERDKLESLIKDNEVKIPYDEDIFIGIDKNYKIIKKVLNAVKESQKEVVSETESMANTIKEKDLQMKKVKSECQIECEELKAQIQEMKAELERMQEGSNRSQQEREEEEFKIIEEDSPSPKLEEPQFVSNQKELIISMIEEDEKQSPLQTKAMFTTSSPKLASIHSDEETRIQPIQSAGDGEENWQFMDVDEH